MASATRITTACNGCRIRKVKCDGAHPCSQCAHFELPCHFTAPRGKRKPGVRNRLVDQLRDSKADPSSPSSTTLTGPATPRQKLQLPLPSPPPTTARYTPASPASTHSSSSNGPCSNNYYDNKRRRVSDSQLHQGHLGRSAPQYTPDFFLSLIPDYEQHVYPVNPIITGDEMRDAVWAMDASHENTALCYAFAAVTINLTQTSREGHTGDAVASQLTDLIKRCLAAHRLAEDDYDAAAEEHHHQQQALSASSRSDDDGATLSELPVTVKRIMTCIFLEISLMAFRLFKRSFAILREAITMVQTLKVYRYSVASGHSPHVARLQRLYWECFIHERFVNVMSGCPAMLQPLSTGLPQPDASIPAYVDVGFRCLILLFSIMDTSFLAHWNAQQDPASPVPEPMSAAWIEAKQSELDRHEIDTALQDDAMRATSAGAGGLSELQHADLFVTRLWLRTLLWQLALSHGLLRSSPPAHQQHARLAARQPSPGGYRAAPPHHQSEDLLSLHYPAARLSSEMRRLVCCLHDVTSIATHGSGILQKLFEVTTTVADVLALMPLPPPSPEHQQAPVSGYMPVAGGPAPISPGSADVTTTAHVEDFIFLVDFLFRFERVSNEERDYMRVKIHLLQDVYPGVGFENLLVTLA